MIALQRFRWMAICASASGCIAAAAALLLFLRHLVIAFCWDAPGLTASAISTYLHRSFTCIARWRLTTDTTLVVMTMVTVLLACGWMLCRLLRRGAQEQLTK
ncbi:MULTISPECIES: hypothetical protein [Xanthomonas]|uniref:hypothetical protein n=1 Tax=Xanthomonas TaxID=338 RepID=UPI0006F64A08|nr:MULTISPECIES: hypothetical protein [Xanthomonas]KQR18454.1 hypothetical protein ASF90_02955 [Xanthomonas sp. Leaf148]